MPFFFKTAVIFSVENIIASELEDEPFIKNEKNKNRIKLVAIYI